MRHSIRNQLNVRGLEVGPLLLGGLTLAVALAACSNDPIVYPNRNLRAAVGGDTSESGAAGEAGEASTDTGGAAHGGSGGANESGGKGGGQGGSGGKAGSGGAPVVGPVCGDGKLEAPEECDDGNIRSGDGCSWDCRTACEICEQNVCPQFDFEVLPPSTESAYNDCYKAMGKIQKGPAAGYPRAEVCQELMDCIREEECGQTRGPVFRPQKCWCDKDWTDPKNNPTASCQKDTDPKNPTDPTRFIPGKCASLFQDGSEAPALIDVTSGFAAILNAEGAALRLLTGCDARECPEECLPTYFKDGGIATITADIVAERNAAGESALGDLVADSHRILAAADFALVDSNFVYVLGSVPDLLVAATEYRAADAPGRVLWSEALRVNWGHGQASLFGQSTNAQADGALYKVSYTGQQIYDALNEQFIRSTTFYVSGLRYEWDAAQPAGSKVVNVLEDGSQTSIDKAATYTVAVTNFLTNPNGPILALRQGSNATLVQETNVSEILGEYLQGLPQPVAPPELNRIKRLN